MNLLRLGLAAAGLVLASPLAAEVREVSDAGFVVQLGIDVPASPAETWSALLAPSRWWNAKHTFSQSSANLSIDPRAGGCFCEVLPNLQSPNAAPRGSAEHMRVIYLERPRALRMSGALGPLQAGAGTGTLTVILKPHEAGTRILWEYAYGGYLRGEAQSMAALTDRMLSDQLLRLGSELGAAVKSPVSGKKPSAAISPFTPDEDDFAREILGGLEASDPSTSNELSVASDDAEPQISARDPGFIGR